MTNKDEKKGDKKVAEKPESNSEEEIKTFKSLIKEVHEKNLCGGCGGCISFCSAHELKAIEMGEEGKPIYVNEDNCLKCGICYIICPQINIIDDELREKHNWKPPIGHFQRITVARSTNNEIRSLATDGGVVTSLLLYMLEQRAIDGAIVSKKTGPFCREPLIATTKEDLLSAAGSRFAGLSHVEELGKYTTYSPTLYGLKDIRNLDLARIAVVGTPCQIHTIRKMQVLGVLPSHVVKFTIGLFCMENFSFDELARQKLEKEMNLKLEDIVKINIKEDLIIDLKGDRKVHIPFEDLDKLARPACLACTDFANDFADISVGGLGAQEGYTTTVLRTDIGMKRYKEAVEAGYLEERAAKGRKKMQIEKTKTLAKIINFADRKRQRGLATLNGI
ncbi:MAG: Coenzyme F420 hydrogenase/dehydrogenase, beta subunit C-terminal domain [Thermoplasmata archaeon]